MSVTFSITANSAAEFEALESEGAPQRNMGNGAGMLIAEQLTGEPMVEQYGGTIDPREVEGRVEATMQWARERDAVEGQTWVLCAESPEGGFWHGRWESRVEGVVEVLNAATRLGRTVSWG
jgi:hypothetical protein